MALSSNLTIQSVHGLKETFAVGPTGIVPVGSTGTNQNVPLTHNRAASAKVADQGTSALLRPQNPTDRT